MTKSTVTPIEFPRYKIVKPEDHRKFKDGDTFAIPFESKNHGTLIRSYRLGSVVGYSLEYAEDPIEAYKRAKANGHKLHWANQQATVITNYTQEQETIPGFNFDDTLYFHGKEWRLVPAPNGNVELAEI